mgnify:CR=1 FL=1
MNKYEIFTLAYAGYAVYMSDDFDHKNRTDRTDSRWSTIDEKELKIFVKQHEDYNITKYFLRFQMTVEKAIYNGKEYKQQSVGVSSNPSVVVPLDFDKKVNLSEVLNLAQETS